MTLATLYIFDGIFDAVFVFKVNKCYPQIPPTLLWAVLDENYTGKNGPVALSLQNYIACFLLDVKWPVTQFWIWHVLWKFVLTILFEISSHPFILQLRAVKWPKLNFKRPNRISKHLCFGCILLKCRQTQSFLKAFNFRSVDNKKWLCSFCTSEVFEHRAIFISCYIYVFFAA